MAYGRYAAGVGHDPAVFQQFPREGCGCSSMSVSVGSWRAGTPSRCTRSGSPSGRRRGDEEAVQLLRARPVRPVESDMGQLGAEGGEQMRVAFRPLEVGEGIEHRNAARRQAAFQVAKEIARDQIVGRPSP
jgi:hypothetical protein